MNLSHTFLHTTLKLAPFSKNFFTTIPSSTAIIDLTVQSEEHRSGTGLLAFSRSSDCFKEQLATVSTRFLCGAVFYQSAGLTPLWGKSYGSF